MERTKLQQLDSEIAVLLKKRDSCLAQFDKVTNHCLNQTYCHKNFRGSYFLRDHCLVCGVDSIGQLFMVANTFEASIDKHAQELYDNSEIRVRIADSTYETNSSLHNYTSLCTPDTMPTLAYICACVPEERTFMNGSDNGILDFISRHSNQKILFCFISNGQKLSPQFTLGDRYKKGISGSTALSRILMQLNQCRKERALVAGDVNRTL